jgi:lysophospholipase L1-like esterase
MAAATTRAGTVLANILLVVISIVITLAVAEVVMRSLGYSRLFNIYTNPSPIYQYDSLLGWAFAPNSKDLYYGPKPFPTEFSNEIHINSDGLRGSEIRPLSPGGQRVLFLGDSRVAALEVPEHETFSALLANRLSDALGHEVQVINAGVRGYGTDQSYLYYTSKGYKFEPDLVVFMHSGNDISDNLTLHSMKRPFGKSAIRFTAQDTIEVLNVPVPDYQLCSAVRLTTDYQVVRYDTFRQRVMCKLQMAILDHSALASYLITALGNNPELIRKLNDLTKPAKKTELGTTRTQAFKYSHTSKIIKAMQEAADANGSAFLFVIQDFSANHVDPQLMDGVNMFLLGVGDEQVTWKNDGHYTPHGHEVVAGRLLPAVRAALESAAGRR